MTTNNAAPEASAYTIENEEFNVDERPLQTTSTTSDVIGSGWDSAETLSTPVNTEFPTEFKQTETPQIIKFIDQNGPFATYKLHFLQGKVGKKGYLCLNAKGGNNCPLCSVLQHRDRAQSLHHDVHPQLDLLPHHLHLAPVCQ